MFSQHTSLLFVVLAVLTESTNMVNAQLPTSTRGLLQQYQTERSRPATTNAHFTNAANPVFFPGPYRPPQPPTPNYKDPNYLLYSLLRLGLSPELTAYLFKLTRLKQSNQRIEKGGLITWVSPVTEAYAWQWCKNAESRLITVDQMADRLETIISLFDSEGKSMRRQFWVHGQACRDTTWLEHHESGKNRTFRAVLSRDCPAVEMRQHHSDVSFFTKRLLCGQFAHVVCLHHH